MWGGLLPEGLTPLALEFVTVVGRGVGRMVERLAFVSVVAGLPSVGVMTAGVGNGVGRRVGRGRRGVVSDGRVVGGAGVGSSVVGSGVGSSVVGCAVG